MRHDISTESSIIDVNMFDMDGFNFSPRIGGE